MAGLIQSCDLILDMLIDLSGIRTFRQQEKSPHPWQRRPGDNDFSRGRRAAAELMWIPGARVASGTLFALSVAAGNIPSARTTKPAADAVLRSPYPNLSGGTDVGMCHMTCPERTGNFPERVFPESSMTGSPCAR